MKINLLFIFLPLLSLVRVNLCQEDYQDTVCPTKTELDNESGYPKIFQINSTAVSVDWSQLWPSLEMPSPCLDEVKIVVNGQSEIEIDELDVQEAVVPVQACVELEIKGKRQGLSKTCQLISDQNEAYNFLLVV